MNVNIGDRCRALVAGLGFGRPEDLTNITPLTGGVASDIASFELNGEHFCAKFALEKLKVAEDWSVPVHRNAAEYAWLEFAAKTCPEGAVRLFGRSEASHGFVMEFITGPDVYLWKTALLNEAPDRGEVGQVARLLGRLQRASAKPSFDTAPFQNREDFQAIRIEPYLSFTAGRHQDLAKAIENIAEQLHAADKVLVHGDISPKNILVRSSGPVFLDAECATMGDASFDPAFCLNHLVLKSVHLPNSRDRLLSNVLGFWQAYVPHVAFEDPIKLESRISRLLPVLMLARVDGKSPVEYLSEAGKAEVRRLSRQLISDPVDKLDELVSFLRAALD